MRYRWTVTFEKTVEAHETAWGEIDVPNPRLAARRAVEGAQRALPGQRWSSMVILLEKAEPSEPTEA